jgi:hypothetical protein
MTEAPFFQTIINKSKVNDVLEPMQQMNAPQAIPHRDKSLKIFSLPNNRSDTESPFHDLPNSNSTYTLPRPSDTSKPNSKIRLGLRHFETAPYEGWKAIKKWARLGKQQLPKKSEPASNLMREIEANGLAPMLLAMRFKKDEKDANRIPVLLSNISVRVTKEERPSNMFKRKAKKYTTTVFKIQVDYGTGPDRMTWVVYRRYWDFVKLHYKYKTMRINKLPKFPSLPRHHFRHQKKHKKLPADNPLSSMDSMTQVPSIVDEDAVMALMAPTEENVELDIVGVDKTMLMAMEKYLNQFIAMLNPCGYTNRLCRFLEISTLGMYLAFKYPEGHHGKEGFAVLQSRSDRDPKYTRQFLQDGFVCSLPTSGGRRRRFPKWFIVRESYIICVNDPSEAS